MSLIFERVFNSRASYNREDKYVFKHHKKTIERNLLFAIVKGKRDSCFIQVKLSDNYEKCQNSDSYKVPVPLQAAID